MKVINLKVKQLLKSRGITSARLADAMFPDTKPASRVVNMSNLLTGKVAFTLEHVRRMCEILECEPSEIFEIND